MKSFVTVDNGQRADVWQRVDVEQCGHGTSTTD
jgi:hypothetical protein